MEMIETVQEIKKNGFWFVDIPRTSSSSIKVELRESFGAIYGKSSLMEEEFASQEIIPPHISAMQMKNILGANLWDSLFTFTIVRNPWDRLVSLYNYRKIIGNIHKELTFKEYVLKLENRVKSKKPEPLFNYSGFYLGNAHYVLDKSGSIVVNYIGKYENRRESIAKIQEQIGVTNFGKLNIQKANEGKHYSQYYDECTKFIVEKSYKKDIELFDYTF